MNFFELITQIKIHTSIIIELKIGLPTFVSEKGRETPRKVGTGMLGYDRRPAEVLRWSLII